jgi:AcrR family transcriptional regulator
MTEKDKYIQRENRILDVATKLLLHYGYDKTTVNDIAREAGVAKGTIYLHFDSKETLFNALIMREFQIYGVEMMERLQADETLWSFVGMYRIALGLIAEKPLIQSMMRGDKQILGTFLMNSDFIKDIQKEKQRALVLKQMQDVGAIRKDVDIEVAQYLMSCMGQGMVSIGEIIPPEQAPPTDDVIMMYGEMLEKFLLPADGGNKEAGRQLVIGFMDAFNERMKASEENDA